MDTARGSAHSVMRDRIGHWAARPCGWAAALLLLAAPAAGAEQAALGLRLTGLSALFRGSSLVVTAQVGEIQLRDNGRLRIAEVTSREVFKGEPPVGQIAVVETRDFPSMRPTLRRGLRGVLFLRRLQWNSYFRKHLPAPPSGGYWQLHSGHHGALLAEDPNAFTGIVDPVREASRVLRGEVPSAAEQRAIVVLLLSSPSPRLVHDGVRSLPGVAALSAQLTPDLRAAVVEALERQDLPVSVRRALLSAVARLGAKDLVEQVGRIAEPVLSYDLWKTLEALGQGPSIDELHRALNDPAPARRVAALRMLRERRGEDAISVLANAALHDPDEQVRVEATEQLGATKSVLALRSLERIFADPTPAVRQAAARAIMAIGGRPAQETLARLAREGPADAQRYATGLFMMSGIQRDDPLLEDLRKNHPDRRIREMAEHGIQLHH